MTATLGYRSTALDALRGADLSGKVAVVTGEAAQQAMPGSGRPTAGAAALLLSHTCCLAAS